MKRIAVGLLAPARTPAGIVAQIAQATRTTMAEPDLQKLFHDAGMDVDLNSNPEKTRRFIEQEIARWTPVIRSIGLKLG
jgi:tripartite-type tricarboxylate transporter receptor subunit TctC